MLLAYLDEFGHVGSYIPNSRKYNHHPIFGYAGFIIPHQNASHFGGTFEKVKENSFAAEIADDNAHPKRWEKKGSDLLTDGSWDRYQQHIQRDLLHLSAELKTYGGRFFFKGELKPIGTEKHTGETSINRSQNALNHALQALAKYADHRHEELLIILDQVDDNVRAETITSMASYIYSLNTPVYLRRIVEVPLEAPSVRYGNIQFADWFCSVVSRVTSHRFADENHFKWAPTLMSSMLQRCGATFESGVFIPARKKLISPSLLLDTSQEIYLDKEQPQSGYRIGDAIPQLNMFK